MTGHEATRLVTVVNWHCVEVGLIPDVGLTVNERLPIGESEFAHPLVGEPLVEPYGFQQVTVPMHVTEPWPRSTVGQVTPSVVGSVTNIEENGSRELYIGSDVVDPTV